MEVIANAGRFTRTQDRHWVEHMRSADLSVGTYSVPAGGVDGQSPHTEDEVYVVTAGRATMRATSGEVDAGPGTVIFVPAGEEHRFVDITEDFAVLVIFAPPEYSRG